MSGLVIATTLTLLSGCTTPGDPTTPPSRSSSPTSTPTTRGPAPSAPRTLDLAANRADPCVLFGADDFTALGFTGKFVVLPADPPEGTWGFCEVGGGRDLGRLVLELRPNEPLLQNAYADTSDTFEVFEPTTIRGFPAVKRAYSADVPSSCTVVVGTGERQGLSLDYTASDLTGGNAAICAKVVTTAEAVLRRLGA
jgi:hypothetical protein